MENIIEFIGIDSWNRPIFKDDKGNYYGSVDKLFDYTDTKEQVLSVITEKDLLFFGTSFDCEPMGNKVKNLKIKKDKIKFKEADEIHCQGHVSISDDYKNFPHNLQDVDFGMKIGFDGKVWICINGSAFIRFKPKFIGETK